MGINHHLSLCIGHVIDSCDYELDNRKKMNELNILGLDQTQNNFGIEALQITRQKLNNAEINSPLLIFQFVHP